MIRLIALDFDGTIADYNQPFDAHMARYIKDWQAMGIHVVVASGRPFRSLKHQLALLTEELPIIANNGNILRYKNSEETLYTSYMTEELIKTNVRLLEEHGIHPIFHVDGYQKGYDLAVIHPPNPREMRYIRKYENKCITVTSESILKEPVLVIASFMTEKGFQEYMLQPEISQGRGHYLSLKSTRPEYNLIEVVESSSNKYHALKIYADLMGIKNHEILAAGDDINDLTMVKHAGIGIAMPSAPMAVKKVADLWGEKSPKEYGIFTFINHILEEKNYGY